MAHLILLRHAESMWNARNLFTGGVDVPLSDKGIMQAQVAGQYLGNLSIDQIFVSNLMRAQQTAMIAMANHPEQRTPVILHNDATDAIYSTPRVNEQHIIPTHVTPTLNERCYGDLTGLNKAHAKSKFGTEQVNQWRRSYDVSPPNGESLKTTSERVIPFFQAYIQPLCDQNQNCLICAHGNSLRSLIMYIENYSPETIIKLEIEMAIPRVYSISDNQFERIDTPPLIGQ